ncbi:MAG: Phosphoribosylanthranilate isomerase [Labilithrix sp.]|nr:Phosphoribosylanthranilate isomerase [Labilithrix sp.]
MAAEPRAVHVKICGVTTPADATASVMAGASAIGVNFVEGSPRCLDVARARAIADAVHALDARGPDGAKVIVVGVVADLSLEAMRALTRDAGLDCLQLHGSEPDDVLEALLPHAYKAVRIGDANDVAAARRVPGEYLLVDAKVPGGALGGTGRAFDWSLVKDLVHERRVTVAGGLTPGNVEDAVRTLRPYCVDVASGVESAPGVKDHDLVAAFIRAARRA